MVPRFASKAFLGVLAPGLARGMSQRLQGVLRRAAGCRGLGRAAGCRGLGGRENGPFSERAVLAAAGCGLTTRLEQPIDERGRGSAGAALPLAFAYAARTVKRASNATQSLFPNLSDDLAIAADHEPPTMGAKRGANGCGHVGDSVKGELVCVCEEFAHAFIVRFSCEGSQPRCLSLVGAAGWGGRG